MIDMVIVIVTVAEITKVVTAIEGILINSITLNILNNMTISITDIT